MMRKKSVLFLLLVFSATIFSFTPLKYSNSEIKNSPNEGGQDAFTAAFMKYVKGSFYTTEVSTAFPDLHVKKATKRKDFPGYLYYATSVEIPDFKAGSIVYGAQDQTATAFFDHSFKESELTVGQINWTMTLKWIREALGPQYIEVDRSHGNDKNRYFYLPGTDSKDEKAWHVKVFTSRYESTHHGMAVGFKINAIKK